MMSSQNDAILLKIQKHFESKFKKYHNAQQYIQQELQEISKKEKISRNVKYMTVLYLKYL